MRITFDLIREYLVIDAYSRGLAFVISDEYCQRWIDRLECLTTIKDANNEKNKI
ncbi:MAG: hypothetical protein GY853_13275 [PVC group bacterium]|nr:hypothetical protein [PVC group bacterium]